MEGTDRYPEGFRDGGLCRESALFNIGGNKYRLVIVAKFIMGYIFIRFVGTHKEYDKIDASTI